MNKLLILALLSGYVMASTSIETCKTFIKQAHVYQETMSHDALSEMTFSFYKDKVVAHCGGITAKETYHKNFFAQEMMKNIVGTQNTCKIAIGMAKEYQNTTKLTSKIIVNAHKENIADNCGTLVAKEAAVFCLYDIGQ
jgi:hypothetical protein